MRRGSAGSPCWAALLVLLLLTGCGRGKRGLRAAPPPPAPQVSIGSTEEGIASWYGHPYHGRATTSGEIYDMEKLTAAHRTLPFGTRVLVRNLSNGREAEVRIIDRGPFAEDRVIDLSRAAARKIAMIGPGTVRVRVRVIGLPEEAPAGFYAVQVGSFRVRKNAEQLRDSLAREHGAASIQQYDGPRGLFYRVLVGHHADIPGAEAMAAKLRKQDLASFVVRVDEMPGRDRL